MSDLLSADRKRCSRCKVVKHRDEFHQRGRGTSIRDRHAWCKECANERNVARRERVATESAEEYAGRVWLWLGSPAWLTKPGIELSDIGDEA